MESKIAFFDKYKYCQVCKRLLSDEYEFEICPTCIEQELFKEVRDYIRKNSVTEYDVAEHFNLPMNRVRTWIREGRIQYREGEKKQVIGSRCARCGELISKGDLCVKCVEFLKRKPKGTISISEELAEAAKMRFFEEK